MQYRVSNNVNNNKNKGNNKQIKQEKRERGENLEDYLQHVHNGNNYNGVMLPAPAPAPGVVNNDIDKVNQIEQQQEENFENLSNILSEIEGVSSNQVNENVDVDVDVNCQNRIKSQTLEIGKIILRLINDYRKINRLNRLEWSDNLALSNLDLLIIDGKCKCCLDVDKIHTNNDQIASCIFNQWIVDETKRSAIIKEWFTCVNFNVLISLEGIVSVSCLFC